MNDILQQLIDGAETLLLDWCNISKEEGLLLEFKTKSSPTSPNLSSDDKQNIGKALSGFSNSEGGVVVWGVQTKADQSGIDAATTLSPISDIARFKSLVDAQLPQLVSPSNPDVETHILNSLDNESAGYLVLWIGQSDDKPHMSTAKKHQRYYRRTSQGFRPLENYEVREMFLARRTARLVLETDIQLGGRSGQQIGYVLALKLKNDSDVMAQFPYFAMRRTGLEQENLSSPMTPLPNVEPETQMFTGGSDVVIHCGEVIPVVGLRFAAQWVHGDLQVSTVMHHQKRVFRPCSGNNAIEPLSIEGRFGCANVRATPFTHSLPWSNLEPRMRDLAIGAFGDYMDF